MYQIQLSKMLFLTFLKNIFSLSKNFFSQIPVRARLLEPFKNSRNRDFDHFRLNLTLVEIAPWNRQNSLFLQKKAIFWALGVPWCSKILRTSKGLLGGHSPKILANLVGEIVLGRPWRTVAFTRPSSKQIIEKKKNDKSLQICSCLVWLLFVSTE